MARGSSDDNVKYVAAFESLGYKCKNSDYVEFMSKRFNKIMQSGPNYVSILRNKFKSEFDEKGNLKHSSEYYKDVQELLAEDGKPEMKETTKVEEKKIGRNLDDVYRKAFEHLGTTCTFKSFKDYISENFDAEIDYPTYYDDVQPRFAKLIDDRREVDEEKRIGENKPIGQSIAEKITGSLSGLKSENTPTVTQAVTAEPEIKREVPQEVNGKLLQAMTLDQTILIINEARKLLRMAGNDREALKKLIEIA